jgi:hypothetical protein
MDNIAEEQIIKFLEGQQKVLKEQQEVLEGQQEDIRQIKNDLSKLSELDHSGSTQRITLRVNEEFKFLLGEHQKNFNKITGASESMNKMKTYLDTFFSKFPTELKYEFILGERIKWQLYVLVVVLGIVFTFSKITYDHYEHKNKYKTAWEKLIEHEESDKGKQWYRGFLHTFGKP